MSFLFAPCAQVVSKIRINKSNQHIVVSNGVPSAPATPRAPKLPLISYYHQLYISVKIYERRHLEKTVSQTI